MTDQSNEAQDGGSTKDDLQAQDSPPVDSSPGTVANEEVVEEQVTEETTEETTEVKDQTDNG